jgi:hypothetical protein
MTNCTRIVWDKWFHLIQYTDESSWRINELKMSRNTLLHWLMVISTFMTIIGEILLFTTTNRRIIVLVLDIDVS